MADPITGLLSLGISAVKAASGAEQARGIKQENAVASKWAPLLALNKAGAGAEKRKLPESFVDTMAPGLVAAYGSFAGKNPWGGTPEDGISEGEPGVDSGYGANSGITTRTSSIGKIPQYPGWGKPEEPNISPWAALARK